jgi:transcriptional regulator with XRE-family HTH domain
MPPKLLTQKEFADKAGVSQQLVSRWIAEGIIPTGKGGKINPKKAQEALQKNIMPSKVGVNDGDMNYNQARTKREKYKAGLAQLEYEEKSGRLIDKIEYDKAILKDLAERDTVIKNYILSIPTRCVGAWTDPATKAKLKKILETEIFNILTELSVPDLEVVKDSLRKNNKKRR